MPGGLGRASLRLRGARPGTEAEGPELGHGTRLRRRRFLGDRCAGSAAAMGHPLPWGQEVGTAKSGVAAVVAAVRFPAADGGRPMRYPGCRGPRCVRPWGGSDTERRFLYYNALVSQQFRT